MSDLEVARFFLMVREELARAVELHGPMNSPHEAYAVIKEELDEFWDEVKNKHNSLQSWSMLMELVQVVATCTRAVIDLDLMQEVGNESGGQATVKPTSG